MAESAPALKVEDIHKSFGNIKVLKGISLEAFDHDVISILGSSGSGKSTLLRCINLLETPTSGKVYVRGELIKMTERRAGERVAADRKQVELIRSKLAMVFQQFNLWAHMTVLQNVTEAPIHVLKVPKAEAKEKAEAILQRVGMYDHRNYYPAQLSGGQQQRAAIARALAMEPDYRSGGFLNRAARDIDHRPAVVREHSPGKLDFGTDPFAVDIGGLGRFGDCVSDQ